jgi:hypothetical protein
LDLSYPSNPSSVTLDEEKGYWTETYNTAEEYRNIEFGLFRFTHNLNGFSGPDVGGGMSYWDGFTYCINGDTNDYGASGSSGGWVSNQWGCMAGGGIETGANGNVLKDSFGKVRVQQGNPYMVAYWGYWMETMENGEPCLQINFTDGSEYQPAGIYINNHPWPYYGNIHGDGFAGPFSEGDYFKLYIHGVNAAGEDVGLPVVYTLAEFKNGALLQSRDWEWVDLSGLGTVSGIYFTMESTDADIIYGPNSAVYFCLDKLQVRSPQDASAPSRPTGLRGLPHETNIEFSWNASTAITDIKGYRLYLDDIFKVFVSDTQYNFTGLQPHTGYRLAVEAVAGNDSVSEKTSIVIQTTDETAPSMPANLVGTATGYTVTLTWNASTDNVSVAKYYVFLNGEVNKSLTSVQGQSTYQTTLVGLDMATEYVVEVEARDAAGNVSERAMIILITDSEMTGTENIYNDIDSTDELLRIYDFMGREVRKQPVSDLPRGMYILKYKNRTVKIMK